MTKLLLIRHAEPERPRGLLYGRMPGIHLSERGRAQAEELGQRLAASKIVAVYSSPMDRALETAAPLAARLGQDIVVTDMLNEIDLGDWTGSYFEDLKALPAWRAWTDSRSRASAPGGESMVAVEERVMRQMERTAAAHPDATVALFSHGDPIKSAICHVLGLSLDLLFRFDVAFASVNVVEMDARGSRVAAVNVTSDCVLR